MANKIARRGISIYIDGKEIENSVKAVRAEMKKLISEQAKLTIGSDDYIKKGKQIAQLDTIVQKHNAEQKKLNTTLQQREGILKTQDNLWSKMANSFNKFGMMTGAAIAMITGVSFRIKNMIDSALQWDKVYRSVADAGEVSVERIREMQSEIKKIDTTTSREDLNALAETGLRLGENIDEIAGYVSAVDKVNVVMGKSFGNVEEMATTLGKVRSQFQETKDMKAEDAYTKIASSLNILDKKGAGSAKNIAEFAMNLGSMQDTLKPTIADAMALGTVLEESGQMADKASRAYAIVINAAAQNLDKFAKFMGISRKELEDLINTKPVEFLKQLSVQIGGLSGTGASQALKELGIGANEAQKFLGNLSNKIERVTELQNASNEAYREGTNINESFAIKNEGVAASIEKARKRVSDLREELGNKLMPVYASLHISTGNMLNFLVKNFDIILGIVKAVMWLTGAYIAYRTVIFAVTNIEKAYNGIIIARNTFIRLQRLRTLEAAAAEAIKTKSTYLASVANREYYAQLQKNNLATKIYTTNTGFLGIAKNLLTGNIKGAITAFKSLNTVMKANILFAVGAAITGLIIGIVKLVKSISDVRKEGNQLTEFQKTMNDVTKETNTQVEQESLRLEILRRKLEATKPKSEERIALIKQLNKEYPDLLGNIKGETASVNDLNTAIKTYISKMEGRIKIDILYSKISEKLKKLDESKKGSVDYYNTNQEIEKLKKEYERQYLINEYGLKYVENLEKTAELNEKKQKALTKLEASQVLSTFDTPMDESTFRKNWELKNKDNIYLDSKDKENEINKAYLKQIDDDKKLAEKAKQEVVLLKNDILYIDKQLEEINNEQKETLNTNSKITGGGGGDGGDTGEKSKTTPYQERLKELELWLLQQSNLLRDDRKNGILEEEAYNEELKRLTLEYLDAKYQAAEDNNNETRKTKKGFYGATLKDEEQAYADLLDAQEDFNNFLEKQEIKNRNAKLKIQKDSYDADMKVFDEYENLSIKKTGEKLAERLVRMEAYLETLKKLAPTEEIIKEIVDVTNAINKAKKDIYANDEKFKEERKQIREKYGLNNIEEQYKNELETLKKEREDELITEEEFQLAKFNLRMKYAELYVNASQKLMQQFSDIVTGLQDLETAKIEAKYEQQYAALDKQLKNKTISQKNYDKQKQKLDDAKRKEEIETQKKYAAANLAMQISSIIAATALSAMQSFSAMSGIPIVGPVLGGIAAAAATVAGAIQIAKAKAEYDKVMALQYAQGGFTPRGHKYQPVGTVHANEYVVPQEGTQNSDLLPVLNVIEAARRSGNLVRLKRSDLQSALGGSAADMNSPSLPARRNFNQNTTDLRQLENTLREIIITQNKLNERLENGIEAYSVINGRNGSYQRTKDYQKLISNASR